MDSLVEIKNLSKSFDREILSNIDFVLSEKQIIGLLGRNGAGKTTLIKIILGFLKPSKGTILVFGKEPGESAGTIGYLPEKPNYHLLFSGKEYLTHLARISGVDSADKRVKELLALVGMEGHGQLRMSRYSKGMLQRIGLAQALLLDPKLLILDEPLSGLDPAGQKDLRDVITQLGSLNKTILLCSHLLGEVEKVCSDIAILHQGRLIKQGAVKEILEYRNRYKFRLTGLTKDLFEKIKVSFCVEQLSDELLLFDEQHAGEKEVFIKILIEEGIKITELVPYKRDLEELFLVSTGSDQS